MRRMVFQGFIDRWAASVISVLSRVADGVTHMDFQASRDTSGPQSASARACIRSKQFLAGTAATNVSEASFDKTRLYHCTRAQLVPPNGSEFLFYRRKWFLITPPRLKFHQCFRVQRASAFASRWHPDIQPADHSVPPPSIKTSPPRWPEHQGNRGHIHIGGRLDGLKWMLKPCAREQRLWAQIGSNVLQVMED